MLARLRPIRVTMSNRLLTTTAFRSSSHVQPNPHEWDKQKSKKLSKEESVHPEEAEGWNEQLATVSEADVKADKSSKSIDELAAEVNHVHGREVHVTQTKTKIDIDVKKD